MSQYTRLNQAEVGEILAQYGLPGALTCQILSGGSENTNYLVETPERKYVLSICEQKSIQQATELAKLLEYLAVAGFQTSKLVRTPPGEVVSIWGDKPILLKEFIEGEIQQDLSPRLLTMIGKRLAQLHQIPAPAYLPQAPGYGIEQFAKVEEYAADSEFAGWLKEITTYLQPYLDMDLPKAFIHSDLFWSNIIIQADKPAIFIMDFEEATHYYRVFDIGMTIIGICAEGKKINLEKARHLLKGYQSEIPLLPDELAALHAFTVYAGTAMTFWRHRNFNYVKPDPAMFDHYRGLKVLVDFMMEQDADCLLQSS